MTGRHLQVVGIPEPEVPAEAPLLGATVTAWLTGRLARSEITAETHRTYSEHLRRFVRYQGPGRALDDITADDIEAWLGSMQVQAATLNTRAATVRAFFSWATERGLIERNPTRAIKRAKVGHRPPKRLTGDQLARVITAADFRARVVIILGVQLMLRLGELAKLRIEDYDPAAGTLYIRGKGQRDRILPVTGEAAEMLGRWLADERVTGPMWPSRARPSVGLSTRAIGMIISRAGRDAGIHLHPHMLRHTGASDVAASGAPIPALQRALGHANLATTSTYTHATDAEVATIMAGRRYRPGCHEPPPVPPRPAPVTVLVAQGVADFT